MAKVFNSIKPIKLSHSNFNLSYDNKFTCAIGELVPVCVKEMLPSDVFRYNIESVVRANPTFRPIMHKLDLRFEAFFVPHRIVWEDWEDFITGKDEELTLPTVDFTAVQTQMSAAGKAYDLLSYVGLPNVYTMSASQCAKIKDVSDLYIRSYNLIYNTYYRAPEVQNEISLNSNYLLLYRNWSSNDYFTSALPYQLQGGVEPTIGSTGFFPLVTGDVTDPGTDNYSTTALSGYNIGMVREASGRSFPDDAVALGAGGDSGSSASSAISVFPYLTSKGKRVLFYNDAVVAQDEPTLRNYRELGVNSNFSFSASELRRLMATEQFLERNARCGERYTDQILARFNVFAGDSRLDYPEFLGSARSSFAFGEVPNTTGEIGDGVGTVQGSLAGKGFGGLSSKMCKYRAKEHGYFIVLMSIIPKLSYCSNALPREFTRKSRTDFFTPEYEHIGEQPIFKRELWINHTNVDNGNLFFGGYSPIYNEYRYSRDLITTGMLVNDYLPWHLGRNFGMTVNGPVLNDSFLSLKSFASESERIFSEGSSNGSQFICDVYNDLVAYRPMSKYGEPGISYF